MAELDHPERNIDFEKPASEAKINHVKFIERQVAEIEEWEKGKEMEERAASEKRATEKKMSELEKKLGI